MKGPLADIERYGMGALVDVAQGGLHGPVAGEAGHGRERRSADADREMAFAAAIVAGMPGMAVAFVHDLQQFRRKGACQAIFYLILDVHFSGYPFYPPRIALNF